jgi:small-conductance mechanosensitive channel
MAAVPLPDLPKYLLSDRDLARNLLVSAILLSLVIGLRFLTIRSLGRFKKTNSADPLRLRARTRWVALAISVLGMVVIWADELHTVALSLVAIAAALVLATKELIMCLSGTLVRASGGSFEVGDRIEVDGLRGDVIDHQLLTTTLLEIGPGHLPTGRTVVLPNSVFLSSKVFNESLTDHFVLHMVRVPLPPSADVLKEQTRLLTVANDLCAPHAVDAAQSLDSVAAQHGLSLPPPQARVLLDVSGGESVGLLLQIPVPARRRGEIEQDVLLRFLS